MSDTIILHNIKNIKELRFDLPSRNGVYLLTGVNGCGKTSLLVAINRIGNANAFSNYNSLNRSSLVDAYTDSVVEYIHDGDSVKYVHGEIRWVPTPKSKATILDSFKYRQTMFVSTTGLRFYQQIPSAKTLSRRMTSVGADVISSMNKIFDTTKFSNLKYITTKAKRGKQRVLHRSNKLYIIQDGGLKYSEVCFSLGERLVLNTLDMLSEAHPHSILMVDEIELALHPAAQIRFYDYLSNYAHTKDCLVLISTHSSSLVKHAHNNIYYLDVQNDGTVVVKEKCTAAYILKDISETEELQADFIFLVEDVMAERYLRFLLRRHVNSEPRWNALIIRIIYVGGYYETIKMSKQLASVPPYSQRQIQAFLDKDVESVKNGLDTKTNRTPAEQDKYEWFSRQSQYISFLNITPEHGFYEWLSTHQTDIDNYITNKYGQQPFTVTSIYSGALATEAPIPIEECKKRDWAKGFLKNFTERLQNNMPSINENQLYDDYFECMVKSYSEEEFRTLFTEMFNSVFTRR